MKLSSRQLRGIIREELYNEVRHPALMAPGMTDDRFVWEFGEFHEEDCPGESGVCLPPEGDQPPPSKPLPSRPKDDQSGYEDEYNPYYQTRIKNESQLRILIRRVMISEYYSR